MRLDRAAVLEFPSFFKPTACERASLVPSGSANMDSSLLAVSLFIAIVMVAVLIGHWMHATKFQFASEGSVGILLGVLVAGIYYLYYRWISDEDDPVPVRLVELNESLFFQVMLPPIIFYAGFSVKKKLFFQVGRTGGRVHARAACAGFAVGGRGRLCSVHAGSATPEAPPAAAGVQAAPCCSSPALNQRHCCRHHLS